MRKIQILLPLTLAVFFSLKWNCPAQDVQYPLVFPLNEYSDRTWFKESTLKQSERNRRKKEKIPDIRIPKFPDNCDLAKQFELAQFFQKNEFEDHTGHDSYFAWSLSVIYRDGKAFVSVEPSRGYQLIDRMREHWKTQWQTELPEWIDAIHAFPRNYIPDRDFWRMRREGHEKLFEPEEEEGPLCFVGYRGATSEIMPEKSTALVLRDKDNIYMVCAYNNFFTINDADEPKDQLMDDFLHKGQLRYVFLGTFKLDKVFQAQIHRIFMPGLSEWNSSTGTKKRVDTFEPTGEIFYFDKDGNPELFVSFKEGKLLGPQITWNPDGTIQEYKIIEEPGDDNCERYWVEFGYVDKYNRP